MRKRDRQNKYSDSCPTSCSGGRYGDRQNRVSANLLNTMREGGFPEGHDAGQLRRCSYCGIVYTRVYDALTQESGTEILGHYNNGVLGPGWKPSPTS